MAFLALYGNKKQVNDAALLYALNNQPALVLDCANKADPHRFTSIVDSEAFYGVHIIALDLLYAFRDALLVAPRFMKKLDSNLIVITTFSGLFNYQDETENNDIYLHCWQLMKKLSKRFDIVIAISKHKHLVWARKFCDDVEENMGHTVSSQRQVVDKLLSELKAYGQALRGEDLILYQNLLKEPLKHLGSISNASSLHSWAFLLLSILVEQEKKLGELSRRLS